MISNPIQLRQLANEKADENYEFRQFLKHHRELSSAEVDRLVFGISEKVWKTIDCTTCGNCCREVSPLVNEVELERLACHQKMTHPEFASKFLKPSESGQEAPWTMRERPCPFLKANRCTVYEHRPGNCRDYPYLDKPDFTSRTLSMIGRLDVCPAVFEVWEQLKRATGFRPRRKRTPS